MTIQPDTKTAGSSAAIDRLADNRLSRNSRFARIMQVLDCENAVFFDSSRRVTRKGFQDSEK
jgi:hypothetical protein